MIIFSIIDRYFSFTVDNISFVTTFYFIEYGVKKKIGKSILWKFYVGCHC